MWAFYLADQGKKKECVKFNLNILKLFLCSEPAPPKSLFAVNKTQTSVTLLWVEEGVADFFEVFCQQVGSGQETKLQVLYMLIFSELPLIKAN